MTLVPRKPRKKEQHVPPPSIERGTSPLAHCHALHKGRAAFLWCTASAQDWHAPGDSRPAAARTGSRIWRTKKTLPCPPQGQGSILQHHTPQAHATRAARTISCPALHKGRAASWKPIFHGLKIGLKIQFNSFLHQIKSPSKFQDPRIESV